MFKKIFLLFLGRGFHCSSANFVQAKKYIFARRFVGLPKLEDIQLVEEQLPEIRERGECFYLVKLLLQVTLKENILRAISLCLTINICKTLECIMKIDCSSQNDWVIAMC